VLPRVRAGHPDAYLLGEVIHGDYPAIVAGAGLDSLTQYELWKAIWSSLNDRNFFELAWALRRHDGFMETFAPLTFIGNHDVTRIASRLNQASHVEHAAVIQFTVGGAPAVYYGDEQGFRGVKEDRPGGDDEIRPAFPPRPGDLAPSGWPIFRLHQNLIVLRRRRPWLHRARTEILELTNEHIVYVSSRRDDRITVALNVDDAPWSAQLDSADAAIAGSPGYRLSDRGLAVPAHGWAIVE
jgi:cyclomaltodextrinase